MTAGSQPARPVTSLLATITVDADTDADADGYAELLASAEQHGGLRAWAIEGGYGAGLAATSPNTKRWSPSWTARSGPARRGGRKSDAIDAGRAARDALARTRLAAPEIGPQRAALQALSTARRSAVAASTTAQRQLRALVITAPETVRARFRGPTTRAMIDIAARVRSAAAADQIETLTVLRAARSPGASTPWTPRHSNTNTRSGRSCGRGGPTRSTSAGSARSWPRPCSPPGHTPGAAAPMPRSPCSPAPPHPSPRPRAEPCATGATAPASVSSTEPCTPSPCPGCATTPKPAPTPNAAAPRARPTATSSAASSGASPASQLYRRLENPPTAATHAA